jgi:hypothetical protein
MLLYHAHIIADIYIPRFGVMFEPRYIFGA